MCEEAFQLAKNYPKTTTFRISVRRLSKELPSSSMELNSKIGAFIAEKTSFKVQLEQPMLDIGIEIIGENAFVFDKTISCFGGLPVGIEGKALVLISDEKSLLSALLMMKRGCAIEIAALSNIDFALLQAYAPNNITLYRIKKLSELHELIIKLNCKALVVDDTLSNLKDYPTQALVLRPLIAFSDNEISSALEKYKSSML
jgi:adenylyl- and sulfurtransferase ThiI